MFRDQLIHRCRIIPKHRFDEFAAEFECAEDPISKKEIQWSIAGSLFDRVDDKDTALAMFKKAASHQITQTPNTFEKQKLSIKYQVLCESTAYICSIKQKKSSGEI